MAGQLSQRLGKLLLPRTEQNPQQSQPKQHAPPLYPDEGQATLFARSNFGSFEKSTFSFEFGRRDDPQNLTLNDWDLQYGNGGNHFHVAMVADDLSHMIDLGKREWQQIDLERLPKLPPHRRSKREMIRAIPGHIYLVHTVDWNSDLYALFRVERVSQDGVCDITWKRFKR